MSDRQHYTPSPAYGAQVNKNGEDQSKWTLVLVR
ncbi:MAG: polyketide cyclase, partial [Acidobacteria bacterium]